MFIFQKVELLRSELEPGDVAAGPQTVSLVHGRSLRMLPLEITHIKYRQPLCGRKRVITVFRSKYNVSTTKIGFLLGKYIHSTNMNTFLKTD